MRPLPSRFHRVAATTIAAALLIACEAPLDRCPEDERARGVEPSLAEANESPPAEVTSNRAIAEPQALAAAVRQELAEEVRDDGVLVLVDGRAVTLAGRVEDRRAIQRAILAARAAGAAEVWSRLVAER